MDERLTGLSVPSQTGKSDAYMQIAYMLGWIKDNYADRDDPGDYDRGAWLPDA